MAQQKPFGADKDGAADARAETALSPASRLGARSASFVGGDVDPVTGNLVPGSATGAARGSVVTGSEAPKPVPLIPTPVPEEPARLASVTATAEPAPAYTPPPQVAPPSIQATAPAPPPPPRKDKLNLVEMVSGFFCYGSGTLILMEDGQWMKVEDLQVGNLTALGGMVTATGRTAGAFVYRYKHHWVSGSHAVFENGRFVRVEDSERRSAATQLRADGVYPIATENHLLVTTTHIAADFTECEGGQNMTPSMRLEVMNAEVERLAWLAAAEKRLLHVEA